MNNISCTFKNVESREFKSVLASNTDHFVLKSLLNHVEVGPGVLWCRDDSDSLFLTLPPTFLLTASRHTPSVGSVHQGGRRAGKHGPSCGSGGVHLHFWGDKMSLASTGRWLQGDNQTLPRERVKKKRGSLAGPDWNRTSCRIRPCWRSLLACGSTARVFLTSPRPLQDI